MLTKEQNDRITRVGRTVPSGLLPSGVRKIGNGLRLGRWP